MAGLPGHRQRPTDFEKQSSQFRRNMKTSSIQRNGNQTNTVPRKNQPVRFGTKTFEHRYYRRKIREQLRHLDWALAGED